MAMVKNPFNGNLNTNEVFSAIYNMIISQTMMVPELANNYDALLSKFKDEVGLFGDTKLYYDADVLESYDWSGDSEASNLLAIARPDAPNCQAVTIDQFRQIALTLDEYLSKRAWSTEGAFSQFNSIMSGMLNNTRRLHDTTTFNAFVGTTEGNATKATVDVDITTATTGTTGEEAARLEAETIAQALADLLVEMKDFGRDFNELGYMRAYNESGINFIWNSKYVNKINKVDLPTIFHKEGLIDKMSQYVLPARYFGEPAALTDTDLFSVAGGVYTVKTGVTTVRTLIEDDYTNGTLTKHLFPGDVVPAGYIVTTHGNDLYEETDDIICKVVSDDTYKYLSAFTVGTNFYNPRSLTTNHYLTWGYSKPDYLRGQPLVTVKAI